MKFTCEKYLIQAACAVASRATASKSTIPALEGLLLEADTSLTVSGYDLRKGIYTRSWWAPASWAKCCAVCRTASSAFPQTKI